VKALVVGGGAVGTFLAATLTLGGANVTLVRRRVGAGQRKQKIWLIRGKAADEVLVDVVPAARSADQTADLILIATRAYDAGSAVDSLPSTEATIVTIQNGVGTEELVRERRPITPLAAASLTASVELARNDVTSRRKGGIGLASVDRSEQLLPELVERFTMAGLPARIYPDWRAMKWSKLIANLVGNATSALVDMPVSDVYAHPRLFEVERDQLREAICVVHALGLEPVSLRGADVSRLELALGLPSLVARTILALAVGGGRGGKDPSLRLALTGGAQQTEVDWLNGAVARTGSDMGVDTPVNRALTELVTEAAADPELRNRMRGRPDALVEAIEERRHQHAAAGSRTTSE
jgi:2-dehydropantoate 2-reductase